MYAKCGDLRSLLFMHGRGDVLTWMARITGFVQNDQVQDALHHFQQMQQQGLSPSAVTYSYILKACGRIRAVDKGQRVHDEIVKKGLLEVNIMLGNALVNMYAKCGDFARARQVLEELPMRNVVSWNALIAGYTEHGKGKEALKCIQWMRCEDLSPNVVTFICVLKACGSIKAVDKGQEFHDEISKQRLLKNNTALGNALVTMYARCGALAKAQSVLEEIQFRDGIAWNALIAGFAEHGKGGLALDSFERMQYEGLSPDAITFSCMLKACAGIGDADNGEKFHGKLYRKGMVEHNPVLGNALLDMYAKCGALAKARQVFEELPYRTVISWNALITGYNEHGEGEQALKCLEVMQQVGIFPETATYACILKACGSIGAVDKGGEIHEQIHRRGLLGKNIVLGTALVDMYARCGVLVKARQVLEELPVRNVFTWTALIAGYVENGKDEQALNCFEKMIYEGLSPNAVTLICVFKACGSTGATDKGEEAFDMISKQLLPDRYHTSENEIALGNARVHMYAKCGALIKARKALQDLHVRNVIAWNALMAGYAEHGDDELALKCFEWMEQDGISADATTYACILKACGSLGALNKGQKIYDQITSQGSIGEDVGLGNALVDMYTRCGALAKARKVLEGLPCRDALTWDALIEGYIKHGEVEQAFTCFEQLQYEGLSPEPLTYTYILKACGSIGTVEKGEKIHSVVFKHGLLDNDIVLGTAVVHMYAQCGVLTKAQQMLEELPVRNVICWTALIAGFAEYGERLLVLKSFERMEQEGISPNAATFSCMLSACNRLSLVGDAELYIATMSMRYGIKPKLDHYTSMIDLFGRVGHLDTAVQIIQRLPSCDSAVLSAFLGACWKWGDVEVGRWAFERVNSI